MSRLTLLQALAKPCVINPDLAIVTGDQLSLKRYFHGDLAAILAAYYGADNRAGLLAEGVARDVVGHGEQHERVKLDLRARVGSSGAGDERVFLRVRHDYELARRCLTG